MKRKGFTLIEVLLASVILGIGMAVMLVAVSRCLVLMKRTKDFQMAQWTMGMGDLTYPIDPNDDTTLEVNEDYDITEGFAYARTAEEVEEEGMDLIEENGVRLFMVKTSVKWSDAAPVEEVTRYVLIREDESK